MDLSNIDKRILVQEVLNCQRDVEYYKQQYELEKARADRLAEELGRMKCYNKSYPIPSNNSIIEFS